MGTAHSTTQRAAHTKKLSKDRFANSLVLGLYDDDGCVVDDTPLPLVSPRAKVAGSAGGAGGVGARHLSAVGEDAVKNPSTPVGGVVANVRANAARARAHHASPANRRIARSTRVVHVVHAGTTCFISSGSVCLAMYLRYSPVASDTA